MDSETSKDLGDVADDKEMIDRDAIVELHDDLKSTLASDPEIQGLLAGAAAHGESRAHLATDEDYRNVVARLAAALGLPPAGTGETP
jgi:hypothetical protein